MSFMVLRSNAGVKSIEAAEGSRKTYSIRRDEGISLSAKCGDIEEYLELRPTYLTGNNGN